MRHSGKMMPFEAIVFDFDGTLVDSMNVWDHLAAELLARRGITAPDDLDEVLSHMSTRQSANYLVKKYGLPVLPETLVGEMYQAIEERYHTQVQIKPFAGQYLQRKAEQGYPMCVATANGAGITEDTLRRLGIYTCFSFVVTCDELGISKNEPHFFIQTAHRLGFEPQKVLVVEDSLHSIKAAKKAGCLTAGVFDLASWAEQREIQRTSDYYIRSFGEWI